MKLNLINKNYMNLNDYENVLNPLDISNTKLSQERDDPTLFSQENTEKL